MKNTAHQNTPHQQQQKSSSPRTQENAPDINQQGFVPHEVVQMQRIAGNRATGQMVASGNIQRLMTTATFKQETPGKYRWRSKVAAIDKLLNQYDALRSGADQMIPRNTLLDSIIAKTSVYNDNRKTGVDKLDAEARIEKSYISHFAQTMTYLSQNNVKEGFRSLFKGQDIMLDALRAGHKDPYSPDISGIVGKLRDYFPYDGSKNDERQTIMQELIQDDLNTIITMSKDSTVHPLLRSILLEVLVHKDETYFQETKGVASGAVLAGDKDRDKGITEKYRLDMQLNQAEGSAVRVSSLVHEMTHIATQEHFENTPIHLAFDKGAKDEDVLKLSANRTGQCATLKNLLISTKDEWSAGQYSSLMEKTTYPVEGKNTLTSYANSFKTKMDIADYNRVISLASQGANNTLIEFDTVINQMMYMMTAWKIPTSNAFYAELINVAQEAYDYRNG